jgi:hypothetical protein
MVLDWCDSVDIGFAVDIVCSLLNGWRKSRIARLVAGAVTDPEQV